MKILTFVVVSLAFASSSVFARNTITSDYASYSRLYPTHVEYCAGTAFQFIGGVTGGVGGHGFTYVNGLCRDDSKPYPQVKICDGSEGYAGVGISVNSDFQNVNWVAIPNRALVLDGGIKNGERITTAVVDRLAEEAIRLRVFDGVVIKPELTLAPNGSALEPGTPAYLEAVAKNSIGTDYGLRFARNLECVRVPFHRSRLQAIADRLNALNDSYFLTGKTYVWSGLTNNCAHVASDILENAGIRDAIPTDSYLNLAIPRNGVYTLVQKGFYGATSPRDVWVNESDRESIVSSEPSIVARVGVLANTYDGFAENDVFALSPKALWIIPSDWHYFLESRSAFSEPKRELSDLRENLKFWLVKYGKMLDAVRSDRLFPTSTAYGNFKRKYAEYIIRQINTTRHSLTILDRRL